MGWGSLLGWQRSAPEEVPRDARGARIHQDEHGDVLGELGSHAAHRDHGKAAVHEEHL